MTTKRSRPKALPSVTHERFTHCGKIYITVTLDPAGRPFEIFARFGLAGSCGAAVFGGLTKIISYAFRSGMDPRDAIKALSGIGCHHGRHTCLNAVSEVLGEILGPSQGENEVTINQYETKRRDQ